jgi:hypothetical protein
LVLGGVAGLRQLPARAASTPTFCAARKCPDAAAIAL